jgi:hypothetical protein
VDIGNPPPPALQRFPALQEDPLRAAVEQSEPFEIAALEAEIAIVGGAERGRHVDRLVALDVGGHSRTEMHGVDRHRHRHANEQENQSNGCRAAR